MNTEDFLVLMPVLWVAVSAIVVLMTDLFLKDRSKVVLSQISVAGLATAFYFMTQYWMGASERVVLSGTVAISQFGMAVGLGLIIAAALSSLSAAQYAKGSAVATGEFHALVLFATAGGLVLVIANDLVTFFVALETMSLSVYALTGIARGRPKAAEASMKYFILGAVASGFLLYGAAMLYAATGTMQFTPSHAGEELLRYGFSQPAKVMNGPLATVGLGCMLVALLFKVGAVPFHAWVADAYTGAPAPTTGFMSVAVKAAGFAAFLKILVCMGQGAPESLGVYRILWLLAMFSMIAGNFGALLQKNPKRMLAYSGVAHTGYALIALVVVSLELDKKGAPEAGLVQNAVSGLLFYLLSYAVANLTAFSVLCGLEQNGRDIESLDQLGGLADASPAAAFALLAAMVSLAGVPLTGGFIGKLLVFKTGVDQQLMGLVLIGLITSIASLYYYLQIVVAAYMKPRAEGLEWATEHRWTARFSMTLGLIGIAFLGLYPKPVLALMESGAKAFFAAH